MAAARGTSGAEPVQQLAAQARRGWKRRVAWLLADELEEKCETAVDHRHPFLQRALAVQSALQKAVAEHLQEGIGLAERRAQLQDRQVKVGHQHAVASPAVVDGLVRDGDAVPPPHPRRHLRREDARTERVLHQHQNLLLAQLWQARGRPHRRR